MDDDFAGYEDIKLRWKGNGGAPGEGHRFRLTRFREMPWSPSASYLVKGLIPREGLVVVWGPPKCGKSFWVWDVLAHVALAWEYRGRHVTPGPIVYVACEGERGLGARAEAFRRRHGLEDNDPPLFLVTTRLDLAADAQALIADIRAQMGTDIPHAIAIDTLNRSLSGSESSDEDMGAYVRGADTLREAFGCAVVVIHHCGIDAKRPRGHTSLTGAADAQLACVRDEDGLIRVTVEWLKDGQEGDVVASRLAVVELGNDADGDPITSCVIEAADDTSPAPTRKRPRLAPAAAIALQALREAVDAGGTEPPASGHIPNGVRAVNVELWRRYAYAKDTEGNTEAKRKAFQRAIKTLQAKGLVGCWNDWVWPTDIRP